MSDKSETKRFSNAAFPSGYSRDEYRGMTKRELFAAMAMQGFASLPEKKMPKEQFIKGAVEWADALLAELERGGE